MTAPDSAALRSALDAAEREMERQGRMVVTSIAPLGLSPAAVLRHVAAARQILDSAEQTLAEHQWSEQSDECLACGWQWKDWDPDRRRALATLTALAAAWQPEQQENP